MTRWPGLEHGRCRSGQSTHPTAQSRSKSMQPWQSPPPLFCVRAACLFSPPLGFGFRGLFDCKVSPFCSPILLGFLDRILQELRQAVLWECDLRLHMYFPKLPPKTSPAQEHFSNPNLSSCKLCCLSSCCCRGSRRPGATCFKTSVQQQAQIRLNTFRRAGFNPECMYWHLPRPLGCRVRRIHVHICRLRRELQDGIVLCMAPGILKPVACSACRPNPLSQNCCLKRAFAVSGGFTEAIPRSLTIPKTLEV